MFILYYNTAKTLLMLKENSKSPKDWAAVNQTVVVCCDWSNSGIRNFLINICQK